MKTIKSRILDVLEWWLMMLPFLIFIGWWATNYLINTSCGGFN